MTLTPFLVVPWTLPGGSLSWLSHTGCLPLAFLFHHLLRGAQGWWAQRSMPTWRQSSPSSPCSRYSEPHSALSRGLTSRACMGGCFLHVCPAPVDCVTSVSPSAQWQAVCWVRKEGPYCLGGGVPLRRMGWKFFLQSFLFASWNSEVSGLLNTNLVSHVGRNIGG